MNVPTRTLAELRRDIDDTLGACLRPQVPVAILDFPSHDNLGDLAIWAGTHEWLRRRGHPLVYLVDGHEYSAEAVRRSLPSETVLLIQGGGNFGSVWPEHEEFRRRVLRDFTDRAIVQLPQTVEYRDAAEEDEMRRLIDRASDFTVLCRDSPSLTFARDRLGADARLCPDMAFALGPLGRSGPTEAVPLWVSRVDDERAGARLVPSSPQMGELIDWADVAGRPVGGQDLDALTRRALWKGRRFHRASPGLARLLQPLTGPAHQRVALRGVRRALDALDARPVVVSDRLHAHILCTLLGVPNVVCDTGYGKVDRVVDEFTASFPTTLRARTASEAEELTRALR